jgi:endonuclease/exonuclease/phosphatase family metal-dependent hydrolase
MTAEPGRTEIDPAPIPIADAVREGLRSASLPAFRRTAFFRRHGEAFDRWLSAPRVEAPEVSPGAGLADRIRVVHWNIQQGRAWDRLIGAIEADPRLRDADLWSLNEVDIGMARSGNRDCARELGRRLGMHVAFVANYLEMTKGPGSDRDAPGANRLGLHGLALLSRWPFREVHAAPLPECWDYFGFEEEKRYGCRRVLWAQVDHPRGGILFATAHTEVRRTPACRERQIREALAALPASPGFFAGDWNTHTFRRGGIRMQVREFLRIVGTPPGELDSSLVRPGDREPLLRLVEAAGFHLTEWNEPVSTARQVLAGVEELGKLPAPLGRWLTGRHALDRRILRMRLDWIGVRGPWSPGRIWTLADHGSEGDHASDHAPIGVEAVWTGEIPRTEA